MSSLWEQPPSVQERVVRSPWPDPDVPDLDLVSFVLRHAGRLAGRPAMIDGASGRTVTYGELAGGTERVAAGLAARGFGLRMKQIEPLAARRHAVFEAGRPVPALGSGGR